MPEGDQSEYCLPNLLTLKPNLMFLVFLHLPNPQGCCGHETDDGEQPTERLWLVAVLLECIRFLDTRLFSESRVPRAFNKYLREAELFIYDILGLTRKETGSLKTRPSIGFK